jgi:tetratricopeptide (TPR) repeat protein
LGLPSISSLSQTLICKDISVIALSTPEQIESDAHKNFNEQNYVTALFKYFQLISNSYYPNKSQALYNCAASCFNLSFYAAAVEFLRASAHLEPSEQVEKLYHRAQQLLRNVDYPPLPQRLPLYDKHMGAMMFIGESSTSLTRYLTNHPVINDIHTRFTSQPPKLHVFSEPIFEDALQAYNQQDYHTAWHWFFSCILDPYYTGKYAALMNCGLCCLNLNEAESAKIFFEQCLKLRNTQKELNLYHQADRLLKMQQAQSNNDYAERDPGCSTPQCRIS